MSWLRFLVMLPFATAGFVWEVISEAFHVGREFYKEIYRD